VYITDLKKERKLLTAVFVNGEFWAKIDNDIVAQNAIKSGVSVDDTFLIQLKFDSDYKRSKEKALYLLSFRDYSKKELTDKLKKDYAVDAVQKAVERLEELGLVNDNVFAQKYAKDLLFNKHFSKRRAEFELSQKGINKDVICEVLSELECDPVEQIRSLVDKKYKLAYSDEKVKKRAAAFLQRYGYSWDDIKHVFNTYG
jgi:regulatory protein